MWNLVEIENIEELRRLEGIDDVELREEIRRVDIGDLVKLTLLNNTKSSARETLLVRVIRISGPAFHGELARQPASPGLSNLQVGAPVAFTAAHIHSIPKRQPHHEK
jgi:hypothetical protein